MYVYMYVCIITYIYIYIYNSSSSGSNSNKDGGGVLDSVRSQFTQAETDWLSFSLYIPLSRTGE